MTRLPKKPLPDTCKVGYGNPPSETRFRKVSPATRVADRAA